MAQPTSNLVSQNQPFGFSGTSGMFPQKNPTLAPTNNTSTAPAYQGGFMASLANTAKTGMGWSPVASKPIQGYGYQASVASASPAAAAQPAASGNSYAGSAGIALTPQQQSSNQAYLANGGQSAPGTAAPPAAGTAASATSSTGIPGAFSQMINNQANTQPTPATQAAVGSSQGIATPARTWQGQDGNYYTTDANGNNVIANNQNAINQGQRTLGDISQNQTAPVVQANKAYNDFAQSSPYMIAAQSNPNVAADVASGRSSLLGQTFAQELAAKQAAVSNALTGQGQQISAANEQGGLGISGQGQQISAANNAGNLANSAQSNQITGQQNATSNLLNSLAQQGYVIINKTTGQPLSSQGAAQAAFAGGQTGAAEAAGGNTFAMNQANTAAKGIQGTIQQFLQSNPNLNSSSSTVANAAQQWLQGRQLGDPAYQNLFNYINEYISTLAPILGVGGDTTNLKTQIAQSFINAQASGQSISQVLNGIGQLADQKLANLVSAGQGGGQVAGATPGGSAPTSFGSEW